MRLPNIVMEERENLSRSYFWLGFIVLMIATSIASIVVTNLAKKRGDNYDYNMGFQRFMQAFTALNLVAYMGLYYRIYVLSKPYGRSI